MFTADFCAAVEDRLHRSFNERKPSRGVVDLRHTPEVLHVIWEPGDATRYEAFAVLVPQHNQMLVCGMMGYEGPWAMQLHLNGGYLSVGYFQGKNPGIKNEHTQRKLCQIIAAVTGFMTDANDPPPEQRTPEQD